MSAPLRLSRENSGGARPQNLGGGAFEGQTHTWGWRGGGGVQNRIFKNVLQFAHAVVTGLSPPGNSPPSQKGGDIPRNIAPGGGYPSNIAPL